MPSKTKKPRIARTGGAKYFAAAKEFRAWLNEHHENATELLVGFHKHATGKPAMTWPESVDEALCFGWIDGVRKRVDDARYTIRFTPRRPGSVWSKINLAKVAELERAGKMTDAGRAAFAHRKENRSGIYSYEKRPAELPRPYRAVLDAQPRAARDFDSRPGSYRRAAIWWVVSAKREETRSRRLVELVARHARGETISQFTRRT